MFNAINWFEIPAQDFDRAVTFYNQVLPRPVHTGEFYGVPHGFFTSDEGAVGGAIVFRADYQPSEQGSVLYLNAAGDIEGIMSRVQTAGGRVLLPVTDIQPQGKIAQFVDSEGNRIGLHTPTAQG